MVGSNEAEGEIGVDASQLKVALCEPTLAMYSSEIAGWPLSVLNFSRITSIAAAGRTRIIITHKHPKQKGLDKKVIMRPDTSEERADWLDRLNVELDRFKQGLLPPCLSAFVAEQEEGAAKAASVPKTKRAGSTKVIAFTPGWSEASSTLRPEGKDVTGAGAGGGSELDTNTSGAADKDMRRRRSLKSIMQGSLASQAEEFVTYVSQTEEFFGMFNVVVAATLEKVDFNPEDTTHIYEIVSAMQGLYSFIIDLGEDWTVATRNWLLHMLKHHMVLPVERPDLLGCIIQCLTRDNMLFAPETVAAIKEVIRVSYCFYFSFKVLFFSFLLLKRKRESPVILFCVGRS
jgi:hypothetical protein